MISPQKVTSWFADALPMRQIVPIARFVSEHEFQIKTGGYAAMFHLTGIDDESLTDESLASVSRRLATAFKKLDTSVVVYQYLVKRRGCAVVRKPQYASSSVESIVSDRVAMLEAKAGLGEIGLYFCIHAKAEVKTRALPAHVLLVNQSARRTLQASMVSLEAELGEICSLRKMGKQEIFSFFRHLLNLDADVASAIRLKRDDAVDYQLCNSQLGWKSNHLTIGRRFAQMWALKELPSSSAPNLWSELMRLDLDMVLCSEWQKRSTADTRKEHKTIRTFLSGIKGLSFSKATAAMAADQQTAAKILGPDKSRELMLSKLDDVLVSIESAGKSFGMFSLIGLFHGKSLEQASDQLPVVHRIFGEHEASLIEETQGSLSAYYSLFPGNSKFNVRKQWLEGSAYADLSFVYAPNTGNPYSQSLRDEYQAVYETRDGVPYYFDPYHSGVRGTLIIGPPRAGKSMNGNFLIAHEQKYGGFTCIFDIGRSYEDNVRQHGGTVVHVGSDGPRINPFSLEPTTDNFQFLKGFVQLLLEKTGAVLSPADEGTIFAKVQQVYQLMPERRRMSSLYNTLPPHLKPYLSKWITQYGKIFDNATDELSFSRLQVFEFEGVGHEHQDIMEPILFWLIRRIDTLTRAPEYRGISKSLWFDEVWKHLQNPALLSLIISSLKTGGKHLLGTTLLTQSAGDLGQHAELITNTCPMQLFLADDKFNRKLYTDLFQLNSRELEIIASLQRPREAYLHTPDPKTSKVLVLNLGRKEYWRYTTEPNERKERAAAIEAYGPEKAFDVLAER